MAHLPLLGRRFHLAGSIDKDPTIATLGEVNKAREFVAQLTTALLRAGATFVVPLDAEKLRDGDDLPICFDWLVLETISNSLMQRPRASDFPENVPLIVAVQHLKTEGQIPTQYADMWDDLRTSQLVNIENANQWDMNSKRMEMQAAQGDILITLGGGEGVLFLANLYHNAGKPVIPLNFLLCSAQSGSRMLFSLALTKQNSERFFRVEDATEAHHWINRINFTSRKDTASRVQDLMQLLEALERTNVFGVRLLNPAHAQYPAVENYFEGVVKPVVETLGYKLVIVDGRGLSEESLINLEIFTKLHRSNVVIADMTGGRPNNFIELGYALGRGHRVMVTAAEGTKNPFDIQPVPTHFWDPAADLAKSKEDLLRYWRANARRRPLVESDPLVA